MFFVNRKFPDILLESVLTTTVFIIFWEFTVLLEQIYFSTSKTELDISSKNFHVQVTSPFVAERLKIKAISKYQENLEIG